MPTSVIYQGWSTGPWSRNGWGSPQVDMNVDGVSAAGSIGAVTTNVEHRVDVTGASAAMFLGTVSVSGGASALITGIAGIGEIGDDFFISLNASVTLTLGVAGIGTAGTTLVWGEVDTDQTPNWDIIEAA
jgi:hypothetical protein